MPRGSGTALTCNARKREGAQVMFCLWARARSLVIFHGLSDIAMRSFKLHFVTKTSSSRRRALLLFLCASCDHAACCVSARCWLALLRCRWILGLNGCSAFRVQNILIDVSSPLGCSG
jgi:hypothetical protein